MKKYLIVAGVFLGLLWLNCYQYGRIDHLKRENARNATNSATLQSEIERYKTNDSLNAVKIGVLQLTADELKKYHAADVEKINQLTSKNYELQSAIKTATITTERITAPTTDTIILIDSVPVSAIEIKTKTAYYELYGRIIEKQFVGTIITRDSLVIINTYKRKRFAGFLWKTKKVISREVNAVASNPNTIIDNIQYIEIEEN